MIRSLLLASAAASGLGAAAHAGEVFNLGLALNEPERPASDIRNATAAAPVLAPRTGIDAFSAGRVCNLRSI